MGVDCAEVFLPWRGEFGQMLMHYVRWVHQQIQKEPRLGIRQIVCCRRGDEALFPDADDYFYGWEQVPDEKKNTRLLKSKANVDYLDRLKLKIVDEFGSCGFIEPPKRTDLDPEWNFKPKPRTIMDCPDIDVLVCPRFRKHGQHRNYQHWPAVVKGLQAHGLTVALAGMKQTSVDVRSVPEHLKSWNYDSLDSTLHAMNSARLVLATDAGLAHLAVLNQSPLMVIYDEPGVEAGKPEWPWALPHMEKYATTTCEPILHGWDNPGKVIIDVRRQLGDLKETVAPAEHVEIEPNPVTLDDGWRRRRTFRSLLSQPQALVEKEVSDTVAAVAKDKSPLPAVQVLADAPAAGDEKRQNIRICSMVYEYQKRYWWQLSSLLQQEEWEGHPVPNICAHADISAYDENYGWNDALLNTFTPRHLPDGHKFEHTQVKWPKVEPRENDPFGCRGHIRSQNIRNAVAVGWADWILFTDADMVYDPQFFSHLMTLVDPEETRVYASSRFTMKFEDGYKIVDSVRYKEPIKDPAELIRRGVTESMWLSARGRISGAGFFQLVSVEGLRQKAAEDKGFLDYVPPGYNRDHNTLDDGQTHITRSDKKFRDRLGGIAPIHPKPQYHLNHWRRDKDEYDPEVLH